MTEIENKVHAAQEAVEAERPRAIERKLARVHVPMQKQELPKCDPIDEAADAVRQFDRDIANDTARDIDRAQIVKTESDAIANKFKQERLRLAKRQEALLYEIRRLQAEVDDLKLAQKAVNASLAVIEGETK